MRARVTALERNELERRGEDVESVAEHA
jgi:hypothetical protein